jgi:cobalt-zinc-cadmium efflux system outer membrane protein
MRTHVTGTARQPLGRLLAVGIVAAGLLSSSRVGWSAEPAPGATVDTLLARVRNFNPELAAAALEREAAVAKIYPAGALDDPMVNLSRDQGFRQWLFTGSQDFPLWGKRDLRRGVAEANAAAAAGRADSVNADLEEQTKVVFSQYYQADQAIRVTLEIHSLLHTLAESVRARYAQGLGSQSDAIRAELERTRLEPELSALERDEEGAKAKINALIGRPADAELASPRALRKLPAAASLKLDALMARARSGNPSLATARAEIEAAEGERRLVDKSSYPDVTLTLGGNDLAGIGTRVTGGVGIKVPLQWGVREAQTREASAKKGAAQLRQEAATLKIGSELRSALASLSRAQRTGDLLEHGLSQQSDVAYRSALASYQQGRGDLTSILDAARRRLEVRLDTLRVETEAQTAFAAIERLVGAEP